VYVNYIRAIRYFVAGNDYFPIAPEGQAESLLGYFPLQFMSFCLCGQFIEMFGGFHRHHREIFGKFPGKGVFFIF
jgi:hypothetical protein